MVNKELREKLDEYGKSAEVQIKFLDNPSYDNSIIAITEDGRLVYSYEKMVKEFRKENKCKRQDAIDFIEVNTKRFIPYMGELSPIIITEVKDL